MGKTCAVISCSNDQSMKAVSFFKFRNEEEWLKFLLIANGEYAWETVSGMYICSNHFEQKFIINGTTRRDLARNGYPNLLNGTCCIAETSSGEQNDMEHAFDESGFGVVNLDHCPKGRDCACCSVVKDREEKIKNLTIRLNEELAEKELLLQKLSDKQSTLQETRNQVRVLTQCIKRRDDSKRKSQAEDKESKKIRLEETTSPVDLNDKQATLINELQQKMEGSSKAPFSDFLREFSFQLHYYSPRGYRFLRSYLKCLPNERTHGQWVKHVDTRPGFLKCSLDFLKKKIAESDKTLYYSVSVDEVYIRKEILHDGEGYVGFTDYGDIVENTEPGKEAKTALFIMATAINSDHRVPLGYVLTHGLKADKLATIITKTLETMNKINGRVLNLTFDGLGVNLRAVEKLGAKLNVMDEGFQPYIIDPQTQKKVYIIMDPSHMFKLLRNLWNKYKVLIDKDGKEVKWDHVTDLQKIQQKSGMRLANKLTQRHTNYHQQKMKTNLCVQTLSSSVSVALGVCHELGIKGFEESKPTEEFLALTDKLFDSMNSRSTGKGFKSPLKSCNMGIYRKRFSDAKEYFTQLKANVKMKITPILETGRKTAIMGLLVTIASLESIMEEVVENETEDLQHLPTYRLSQDLLEMFFGVIRSRFGNNNNPNARQLQYALKGILCTSTQSINNGNCNEQETISTRISPLGNYNAIIHNESALIEEDVDEDDEYDSNEDTSIDEDIQKIINNVVGYVSGFAVRKICEHLKCPKCVCKLMADTADVEKIANDCVLILHKDNGGLILPSHGVITVCKITETAIREAKRRGLRTMSKKAIIASVHSRCIEAGLMGTLCCGLLPGDMSHANFLVRELSSKYLKARMHYIAKESTLNLRPTTNRSICVNVTQFCGN